MGCMRLAIVNHSKPLTEGQNGGAIPSHLAVKVCMGAANLDSLNGVGVIFCIDVYQLHPKGYGAHGEGYG